MLALPPRLWRAQLGRLGLLTLAMFVLTAIGADGVPPLTQVAHSDGGISLFLYPREIYKTTTTYISFIK